LTPSSAATSGAFFDAGLHLGRDLLDLNRRDNRAHVHRLVERIADAQFFHARPQPVVELVGDAFLHDGARSGAADLALVEPDRVDDALDGRVEIGVLENDERRLAASSSDSFLPDPAVWRRRMRPTSVEPVKASLAMPSWPAIAAPASPSPLTRLKTPAGRPASAQISAKAMAVSGVCSADFSTTVQPAASAGATFQASISSGKFHGMIWPQTPAAS
jgi:hypothetical protein